MVDSQNLFYFQDSLLCRRVNTVWVCTVALASCRPWKHLLPSHAWPCVWNKSANPQNRGEFSVKSLLLTDLPASKSAEISANSGKRRKIPNCPLWMGNSSWAVQDFYDKIESLRKKSFRNFVFITSGQRKWSSPSTKPCLKQTEFSWC